MTWFQILVCSLHFVRLKKKNIKSLIFFILFFLFLIYIQRLKSYDLRNQFVIFWKQERKKSQPIYLELLEISLMQWFIR